MRRFLYLSLIERLKQLTDRDGKPVIRTFDLWNEQISFLEQEEPFDAPAVFIEFRPVKWTGGGTQTADVTLRLHIVTPWKGSSREGGGFQQQALERFRLAGPHGPASFQPLRRRRQHFLQSVPTYRKQHEPQS